jgi:hypothetical protein
VSINLRIWFQGVEKGDAGETIEREESQLNMRVSNNGKKTKWGRSSVG